MGDTVVIRCYNIDCEYNDRDPDFPCCTLDEIVLGRDGCCEEKNERKG